MTSNLHSEQLSVGLCHGQASPFLAGPLSLPLNTTMAYHPAEADTGVFVA